MTALELRRLAEQLPEGASLSLTKAVILEALATAAADLTVRQVAEQLHRAPSTVRGWLEQGRFEGAYKLEGRDWRIPPVAVQLFLHRQRTAPAVPGPPGARSDHPRRRPPRGQPANLGAWRQVRAAERSG